MSRETKIFEYLDEIETTQEYNGYFCSVKEALLIVIIGSLCGLRNVNQIHQWAVNSRTKEFLRDNFGIANIPCYYWLLSLLKLVKPESLNNCLEKWVYSLVGENKNLTLAIDGKTIRSTSKMHKYNKPLHIVSAQISQLGLTFSSETTEDKSNEIPAVRELIIGLKIDGMLITADAMHCQKETAKLIIDKKADYLLNVKDNQGILKSEIESYVQDSDLQKFMDKAETLEKNSGRIEKRVAFTTNKIDWLFGKADWANLCSIGAINRQVTYKKTTTNEWHYYILSRNLTAKELLVHARCEWSVETMHWLLDVHFGEDFCRVVDRNIQQNLNSIHKIALNTLKLFKTNTKDKRPLSKIMFACLLDIDFSISILGNL